MKRYNPTEIEARWQKHWLDTKAYEVKDDDPRPKFYSLVEFPYPSGAGLHVGHCRPYITFDIMSRWRRMAGENVLYPIGWDSFGLPAEQYAIKTNVHPSQVTVDNINNFRKQSQSLGIGFDWSREFSTSDPEVYKWTQWIFLNLYKSGLAYQAESQIWWCEDLKSVLADEEVINGRSERGDFPCERRPLRQWMLAITKYADRLYDDLDDVDYVDSVKSQQKNWIGRSKGAEIDFDIADHNLKLTVFTTRPDTLFGATYMVLAPEHEFVTNITTVDQKSAVEEYVKKTATKSDLNRQEDIKDKTGVFTGAYAVNPVNQEKIPVWIGDYVLSGYGKGAIMAVPGHDERDHEFAKKFDLDIRKVVEAEDSTDEIVIVEGTMINSGKYNGLASSVGREKIVADLEASKKAIEKTNFKLRDWVFSRQRYWGEPFPIVWVKSDSANNASGEVKKWLPEIQVTKTVEGIDYVALPITPEWLPLKLPDVKDFQPKGLGQGPLATAKEWVNVWYNLETARTVSRTEPKPTDGNWAEASRETDTMPNWAGSSWYYLRYLDPKNNKELASKEKIDAWMPVSWYNGGTEHTTLHLLYSRFWHKFLYDIGIVNTSEPYKKRTSHGIVLADDGRKMSKSWGNVIDPLAVAKDYGADTLRLYIAFIGPFEQTVAWNSNGVAGCRRFIDRFWTIIQEFIEETDLDNGKIERVKDNQIINKDLLRLLNATNKRISRDIPSLGFNTAVASLMEAVNGLYKLKTQLDFKDNLSDWYLTFRGLVILSAPFMPHVSEELWKQFGGEGTVLSVEWPTWDEKSLETANVRIAIQVNGKLKGEITVPSVISEADVIKAAKSDPKVAQALAGSEIVREIYITNRLVNLVIK